jgi:hypothetical protein
LILSALVAAVAGTVAGLLGLLVSSFVMGTGPVSGEDAFGFATLIPVAALILCAVLYTPGLLLLRRVRKACEPVSLFTLTAALVLNVPVVIAMFIAQSSGSPFFGAGEVSIFLLAFIVTGLVFGRGFVSHCRRRYQTTLKASRPSD